MSVTTQPRTFRQVNWWKSKKSTLGGYHWTLGETSPAQERREKSGRRSRKERTSPCGVKGAGCFGIFFFLGSFICLTGYGFAQEIAVPVNLQVPLFLKVLTFDRNSKISATKEIVIGIIYQEKFRTSLNIKDEVIKALTETQIRELPNIRIKAKPIPISDENSLSAALAGDTINILYVTPLRALRISDISMISRTKKILTLTGVPAYVSAGLAVGIGTKGERPQIIINLTQAKAEGVDFSSQLLNLAKVIK